MIVQKISEHLLNERVETHPWIVWLDLGILMDDILPSPAKNCFFCVSKSGNGEIVVKNRFQTLAFFSALAK